MSVFQFLASDKILEEVTNPYIEFISINEAIERNLEMVNFILNDESIDKDEKIMMICDSEEHLHEMQIKTDMYYSSKYAEEFSEKRYFSELQWSYSELRANQLIDYIFNQLSNVDEIEICSIWLDEHKPASIRTINANEFSISDLEFLNLSNGYEKPQCLVIKN